MSAAKKQKTAEKLTQVYGVDWTIDVQILELCTVRTPAGSYESVEASMLAQHRAQDAAHRKARDSYEFHEVGHSPEVYCSKQTALDAAQQKFDALRNMHHPPFDEDDQETHPPWASKVSIEDGHYTWEKCWLSDAMNELSAGIQTSTG